MATEKERDPRTVTLKGIDLSFTEGLFEKKKTSKEEGAVPKHTFNVINLPTGKYYEENNKKIIAALKAAGEAKWKQPEAYKTIAEDNPKRVCFKKAEKFKNDEGKIYAGYDKGGYAFSATGPSAGQKRPKLLDRFKRKLREQANPADVDTGKVKVFEEKDILDIFYGGSKGDVIVSFYGTDKGSRGIFCTAELVRSHQEGQRIGGGGYYVTDDDLDELDDFGDESDGLDDLVEDGDSSDEDDLLG